MNRRRDTHHGNPAAWLTWIGLVFFLVLSWKASAAEGPAAAFDAANRLYGQQAYTEAAKAYEALLPPGQISASILYNLGNAQFKSGKTGRAIVSYRQALLLEPRDPDIQANLKFARNQVAGPTWRPSRGEAWLKKLSLNEWGMIAAVGLWLTLAIAAARLLRPAWKQPFRGWMLTGACFTLLAAVFLAIAVQQAKSISTAVVIAPNVPVRFGPLEESAASFTAADGAELRVLDRKDAWLQVAADSRRNGWIREDQVVLSPGP